MPSQKSDVHNSVTPSTFFCEAGSHSFAYHILAICQPHSALPCVFPSFGAWQHIPDITISTELSAPATHFPLGVVICRGANRGNNLIDLMEFLEVRQGDKEERILFVAFRLVEIHI